MNKFFFLIWENPKSHQIILPLIKEISKNNKIYLFSQANEKIDKLETRDSNYNKYCVHNKIFSSKKFKILNKICLLVFLLISLLNIILKRPKCVYIINKYPLIIVGFIKLFLKVKIIYHNLDYDPNPRTYFQKIVRKFEFNSLNYLDFLIFPHEKRAKRFLKDANIKKKYLIFYNSLPRKYFHNYNKSKNLNSKKKIFYFGSIGPGHGLTEIIKASVYFDKNIILTIHGWVVNKDYYIKILKLIKKINLKEQIKLKINLKDFEWKQEMLDSHLGIALYDNTNLSHKFMFPASQKINAYIAAKLPVLISNSKDNQNFIKTHNCGVCTSLQQKIIAKNINSFFKNKKRYFQLKKNCEKLFKNEFNFENQYSKIENKLRLNYS